MSRDQRPGKIRLVSGQAPATPARRFDDPKAPEDVAALPDAEAPLEPAAARSGGLLLGLFFLVGCAAGGALFTLLIPAGAMAG